MNNIFSRIIILLTVFVGAPTFAQMSCTPDLSSCTGTYSFPLVGGNMGAFSPPATPYTGITNMDAKSYAEREAAAKEGRRQICNAYKAGIPNDITDCKADVRYKNSTTTCPGSMGTFDWSFAYTNGKFFKMYVNLPPQQYDNRNMPGALSCAFLASVSATLTLSKCDTEATKVVNDVCKEFTP